MANNNTSLKLSFNSAERFAKNFYANNQVVHYVFIGNSNQYSNTDTTIPDIIDSPLNERQIWDTMYAAKRINGNDVKLVVPRVNWVSGTRYKEYDDTNTLDTLIKSEQNVKPMYVVTSNLDVYLCLSNNNSANSTVEPTGDYNSANGFVYNSLDGYTWKYLYSIYDSNKFLTSEWAPVPSSIYEQEYNSNERNVVKGSLSKIVVTNQGSGYYNRSLNTLPYLTGVTSITLNDDPTGNIAVNMSVTGNGILSGTYVTDINFPGKIITLSLPTSEAGSGLLNFTTRVLVEGDGNKDYIAVANLVNTNVRSITVTSQGTGYTRANVFIYGTGSGATARAVISPKFGFGFNPARDLVAKTVLVTKKIGEVDSTEGNIISVDTSFRQYGLVSAPHKYGQSFAVTPETSNSIISQTTNLTLVAGTKYTLNEMVYQGSSSTDYTFAGMVHAQTDSEVRLISVFGVPTIGGQLKGNTSGVSRAVLSVENPDLEPYSGDILYAQNISKVQRSDGQAEDIKFVIKF